MSYWIQLNTELDVSHLHGYQLIKGDIEDLRSKSRQDFNVLTSNPTKLQHELQSCQSSKTLHERNLLYQVEKENIYPIEALSSQINSLPIISEELKGHFCKNEIFHSQYWFLIVLINFVGMKFVRTKNTCVCCKVYVCFY